MRRIPTPASTRFVLRLYVAPGARHSVQAQANLSVLCQRYLPDNHEIELIDVLAEPTRAIADGVLVTPSLFKLAPAPTARLIGDLSDERTVLAALGIAGAGHG